VDLTDWRFRLYSRFWKSIDSIFPPACVGCGKAGVYFCVECEQNISPILYKQNGLESGGDVESAKRKNDRQKENSFYSARAFAYHDGLMKKAVHRLKYKNDLGLGKVLAKKVIKIVEENNWDIDLVVPIPLGKKRRKNRGYNQAELIAFPLAHYLGINFDSNIIRRCKETRTQIGLTVKERFENVNGAFEVVNDTAKDKSILLIDDVYTSGATMRSAAQALKDAGAECVYSLTVTRANDSSAQEIW